MAFAVQGQAKHDGGGHHSYMLELSTRRWSPQLQARAKHDGGGHHNYMLELSTMEVVAARVGDRYVQSFAPVKFYGFSVIKFIAHSTNLRQTGL